jgi:hypothetical protein
VEDHRNEWDPRRGTAGRVDRFDLDTTGAVENQGYWIGIGWLPTSWGPRPGTLEGIEAETGLEGDDVYHVGIGREPELRKAASIRDGPHQGAKSSQRDLLDDCPFHKGSLGIGDADPDGPGRLQDDPHRQGRWGERLLEPRESLAGMRSRPELAENAGKTACRTSR